MQRCFQFLLSVRTSLIHTILSNYEAVGRLYFDLRLGLVEDIVVAWKNARFHIRYILLHRAGNIPCFQ